MDPSLLQFVQGSSTHEDPFLHRQETEFLVQFLELLLPRPPLRQPLRVEGILQEVEPKREQVFEVTVKTRTTLVVVVPTSGERVTEA